MLLGIIRNSKIRHESCLLLPKKRYFSVSSQAAVDIAAKDGELRIFIVAGEVSGDTIGSRLMASLKQLSPLPVRFAGVGGPLMSKLGLKSLFPMEDIAVMGMLELLPHINKFRARLKQTVEAAELCRPHVVVTVDSKGFSFRLLKQLRAIYDQQGTTNPSHFHFVAPSFWAWKGGAKRLKGLSKFVDHVFCILPFEENVCRSNGIAATFVGHPILEDVLDINMGKASSENGWKVQGNADAFRSRFGISAGSTVFSLLPGSRLQEVTRMLPIFLDTMKVLNKSIPELTSVIHVAPNQHVEDYISSIVNNWPGSAILIQGGSTCTKYDAFTASRVALCTSGTVALELQLAQLPCVVSYRAHLLTEWLIRYKAKVSYISLPNILLNSPIIPEALFRSCTPSNLISLLMGLMEDEGLRDKQNVAAEKVMKLLSPPIKEDLTIKGLESTPSMIAAYTVLYARREN